MRHMAIFTGQGTMISPMLRIHNAYQTGECPSKAKQSPDRIQKIDCGPRDV